MVEQKKIIQLLPAYLQTQTLSKFFAATADNLFSSADVQFLNGYVGNKPSWYNSSKDVYISEPTKVRQDYQLSPTVVSKDFLTGQSTNVIFYEDIINQLRFQGANVSNHDRLFENEYYSWAPPIDIDKFVNYNQYYWLPYGPDEIVLESETNLSTVINSNTFTYNGTWRLSSTNELKTTPLVFTSGLKIRPINDTSETYNGKSFFIEGVGKSIILTEDKWLRNPSWDIKAWDVYSWDGDTTLDEKQYITIARGGLDQNQWSIRNSWFHIQVLQLSQTSIPNTVAKRPIIEFERGLELYKYGIFGRGEVDLLDNSTSDFFGSVVGQSSYTIQGVPLRDGMRVLVTADIHADTNNRIYQVSGIADGSIQLTLVTNGPNLTGDPTIGDRVSVIFGSSEFQNRNIYFNGSIWTPLGQQKGNCPTNIKIVNGCPPLFNLFDIDGNSMDDPAVYQSSSFSGSSVFSYTTSELSLLDYELGFQAKLDQIGDFTFTNNLSTDSISYTNDGQIITYTGELFVRNLELNDTYINSWYRAPQSSKQYIVNQFDITEDTLSFTIDQEPAIRLPNTLPTVVVTKISNDVTEVILVNNVNYTVEKNIVTLYSPATAGDRIIIKSWSQHPPTNIKGYYEIPKNLSANPNNSPVTQISRSQLLQQMIDIIQNQTGIAGNILGPNNYRDTYQSRGLGLSILQHRAPMIKLGLLNSTAIADILKSQSPIDPMLAMDWAQRSYVRFYNQLIQTLLTMNTNVKLTASSPSSQWLEYAYKQINVGKTKNSPWANSGPSSLAGSYCDQEQEQPTYVPASPARLGITPAYQPIVYFDSSYTIPKLTIQTHDGSRIVMVDNEGNQLGNLLYNQTSTTNPEVLTNPVAAAWLQFELDLYNSLPAEYKNIDYVPVFDVRTVMPGKWRNTDYSRSEVISLMRGPFDKWVIASQAPYEANTGFQTDDLFSFNYRNVRDKQGSNIPGHWQGIYRWFYDTDRPHTHPWEMLGFSQQPSWWSEQYGDAPYTSGNTALWEDLRDGRIRHGDRAGVDKNWARPGLMQSIPVDDQGTLLTPFFAGCAINIPSVIDAKSTWIFGDGSPVESVWINSSDYKFTLAQIGYLMKPARFIEQTWDIPRTKEIYSNTSTSQWVYIDTNSRRSSQQFYVHRERPDSLSIGTTIPNESDLSYFGSCGLQHWISEYVINQGYSVTNYFGNVIRGGTVQLAHKMAGFTASDSFRALVDSFGDISYNTRIIPDENINIYLYKGNSIGESVYSGVIIEQVSTGWRVTGYDAINQTFNLIPGNTQGTRRFIIVGNQRVIEYTTPTDSVNSILYGTILPTRQDVFDFLIGYGRWLESQGWVFDQFDNDSNVVYNWLQSAKEFLFWSQGTWDNGTFITLSPSADTIKYHRDFGNVQYVNGIISGTYPIVDRANNPIQPQDITVLRDQGTVTVQANNAQGIFGLRLYSTVMEHAVIFDNLTSFNDIIYDPAFDIQQQRILIYAYRTNNWTGRANTPGYFLAQNTASNTWTMTSNFDKTASDMTKYFNIEQPVNYTTINPVTGQLINTPASQSVVDRKSIANLARHVVGYQNRNYLQNLLLEDATEFEFYQGFIKQKGTKSTIDKLLRNNTIIPQNSNFDYFEEWLIRDNDYGATSVNNIIDFILDQNKIQSDPQQIRLFSTQNSDSNTDDVFDLVPGDPLIVSPPETYNKDVFALRTSYKTNYKTDLPSAGYVQLGETTYYVLNQTDLLELYNTQQTAGIQLSATNTIWQFITSTQSWTVWRLATALVEIETTVPSTYTGQPTTIITTGPHGLIEGDIVILYGVNGVSIINGTYVISNVDTQSFQIDISTFQAGAGGTILVYRTTRFATLFDRDSNTPPDGWITGDLCYVDEGGIVEGAWTVYKWIGNLWTAYRQQDLSVNTDLIISSELFDLKTSTKIYSVDYWDPLHGRISGLADSQITYKTDYDPAKYTNGNTTGYAINPSEAWSSAQVGQVWWDLSTVRYIEYDQGDEYYRKQNWGKLAPGTSVDVYEWIRSTIPPTDWAGYASEGQNITINGLNFIPSGTVRNADNPNWTELVETDENGLLKTYYYFWVKNNEILNSVPGRLLTTQEIANLIIRPNAGSNPWYAAISSRNIIIGNVISTLNNKQIMQRITYYSEPTDLNIFNEWSLMRNGDKDSQPPAVIWNKMKSSLVTYDGLGNDVPDYHLTDLQKYGSYIRPRQTWFINREAASKYFVDRFNSLLQVSDTPLVSDSSRVTWTQWFNASEPEPSAVEYNFKVDNLAERDNLTGTINPYSTVLVGPTSVTNNRWTLWLYTGLSTISNRYYFDPTISSDINGYNRASGVAPDIATPVSWLKDLVDNTDMLLGSFATDRGYPGLTVIPYGFIASTFFASTPSANLYAKLKVLIYKTDKTGANEKLIFVTESSEFNNTGSSSAKWNIILGSSVLLESTDRLVFKIYAVKSATSDPFIINLSFNNNNVNQVRMYTDRASSQWTLLKQQSYKTDSYWEYIDWYATGYSNTTPINLTVNTLIDLDLISNMDQSLTIKVLDNGSNKWEIYTWNIDINNWKLVGQQDGTIRVLDSIYQWSKDFGGFDGQPFDYQPFDQYAGIEFDNIINGIKNSIYADPDSIEINNLFFAMLSYVLGEQGQVDWLIKTSNIVLKGFNQQLDTYKLLPVDNTSSIIGFITEAKPYHTKVREFITSKTAYDISNFAPVDFDQPPGWYPTPPINDGTERWYSYNSAYNSWLANYQTHPELIRKLKTKIVFDRIATDAQRIGWGNKWNFKGWSNENISGGYGAADRIRNYYNPTLGMIPKILSQLMIGVDYRSTVLNGLGLNIDIGWDVAPWDNLIGWEPNKDNIEAYLDQIVQGGQIPVYDVAAGNGLTRTFNLLQQVSNPNEIVVWSDGNIRSYGVEYITPTYASSVSIVQGGYGYIVGDYLDIVAGTGNGSTRVKVTSVSGGAITGIELIATGSYNIVGPGPYYLQDAGIFPYSTGSDALVDVTWVCNSIEFLSAPAASTTPNIYILYIGKTFGSAPTAPSDTIYSGGDLVMPHIDSNHPEEFYPVNLKSSVRLDTYNMQAGGKPLVMKKVYETNGIVDQFDIGIKPENDSAVWVYLNGSLQEEGLLGDYVINYVTNRIVYITPPAAGLLQIMAISAGGGARSVESVYIANSGTGYKPGDNIELAGGTGAVAKIRIKTVKATSATVTYSGSGYNIGDIITLKNGTLASSTDPLATFIVTAISAITVSPVSSGTGYLVGDILTFNNAEFESPLIVAVSSVGVNGTIETLSINATGAYVDKIDPNAEFVPSSSTSINGIGASVSISWKASQVSIVESGKYLSIPTTPSETYGISSSILIDVEWEAATADVIENGLYNRLPTNPVSQQVTNGAGTNATWNLVYTKRLNTVVLTGDGVTQYFEIDGITGLSASQILVVVDGTPTAFTTDAAGILITPAPIYDSSIVVTLFNSLNYSLITDTSFSISDDTILTYQLGTTFPGSTQPYWLGTTVTNNGDLLEPALTQCIVGDGVTNSWNININISLGSVSVYIDSVLLVNGLNYIISESVITFVTIPADNANIVIACVTPTTNYTITTFAGITYINFATGVISNSDDISVVLYREDVDYGFYTEMFNGYLPGWNTASWNHAPWGLKTNEYALERPPYDLASIRVYLNGVQQTLGYDYTVDYAPIPVGGDPSQTSYMTVNFGANSTITPNDRIVINYMTGLTEKPPIAWRTLKSDSTTLSTAIDNNQKTQILSDVYTTSTSIEIDDFTKVSAPTNGSYQYIYINNELIGFGQIQQSPTIEYPHRAILTNLIRNANVTSGNPVDSYGIRMWNGTSSQTYFNIDPYVSNLGETAFVNGDLLIHGTDYTVLYISIMGTVASKTALPGWPTGYNGIPNDCYITLDNNNLWLWNGNEWTDQGVANDNMLSGWYIKIHVAPISGFRNVKYVRWIKDSNSTNVCHISGDHVIDAGYQVKLPIDYQWEPAYYGLQWNTSIMAHFLLKHSGTKS